MIKIGFSPSAKGSIEGSPNNKKDSLSNNKVKSIRTVGHI